MEFRAKKLRVQLPCTGEDSVIEEFDDPNQPITGHCFPLNSGCPGESNIFHPCHIQPIPSKFQIPCFQQFMTPCLNYASPVDPCRLVGTQTPHCFHGTFPQGCDYDTCLVQSECRLYGSQIAVAPREERAAINVAADYLPVLKAQLEARLREIDVFAQRAREGIEARLADIEVAERALRDRSAPEAGDTDGSDETGGSDETEA